ncbi:hypothetical protein [Bryobacter aggregatus]|uniref:hypothetical protein n=1 Tax=Bryobacter aggregatus TaxID=360054 RepID=UPI00138E4CD2|nr:hypothetical protein [Bryobacter aggregatus]
MLLALAILMPILVFRQPNRIRAATIAMAYFLTASYPILAVSLAFEPSQPFLGPLLWVLAAMLLTTPWAILWSPFPQQRLWRCPAALALSTIPPLGLIGWASPLTASGILFPGTGYLGIAATAILPAMKPLVFLTAILIANTFYQPAASQQIQAIQTTASNDLFQMEESSRLAIHSSKAKLTILPEGAIRRWTEATEAFWEPTIERLERTHRSALIGAGIPIPGSSQYRNAVVAIGEWNTKPFDQRIPIPLGMWKPFGPADGVPLNVTGPGTMQIGPHKLAILICYEQLLVWPMLQSALENPTLIVGISNASWTKHTSIPAAQETSLKAWSRLFGIPYVSAIQL